MIYPFGTTEFVTVIFGGEKMITFNIEDLSKGNIMIPYLYEHIETKEKRRDRYYHYHRFTFTPKMYEEATPIILE